MAASTRPAAEKGEPGLQPGFVPTEDEIADECARIQAGWSAAERERRRLFPGRIAWFAPECEVMAEREGPAWG